MAKQPQAGPATAPTPASIVKTNYTVFRDMLEKAKPSIEQIIPKHMTPERLIKLAAVVVSRNPKLAECTPLSLLSCVMTCAEVGLEPNDFRGQAYFVPFYNKNTKQNESQFILGYRGMITLARRSNEISTLQAHVVHAKDVFDYAFGLEPKLVHEPYRSKDSKDAAGDVIAAYAVCKLKDGGTQWDVMLKHEIDAIRKRSRAGEGGPWVTDYDEMAKKTVMRRLAKTLPMAAEFWNIAEKSDTAEFRLSDADPFIQLPKRASEAPAANGEDKAEAPVVGDASDGQSA